jgi:hypothetical protein
LHQIAFQVPLFPGIAVEQLFLDISVEELNSGIAEFQVDDWLDGTIDVVLGDTTSTAHFEATQISEDASLPRHLQAYYTPGPLPDEGLRLSDGECFTHLVNPSTFFLQQGPWLARLFL